MNTKPRSKHFLAKNNFLLHVDLLRYLVTTLEKLTEDSLEKNRGKKEKIGKQVMLSLLSWISKGLMVKKKVIVFSKTIVKSKVIARK